MTTDDDKRLYLYPANRFHEVREAMETNKADRGDRLAAVMELLGYDVTRGRIHLEGSEAVLSGWGFTLRPKTKEEKR
jgi:hypothetical protein